MIEMTKAPVPESGPVQMSEAPDDGDPTTPIEMSAKAEKE